ENNLNKVISGIKKQSFVNDIYVFHNHPSKKKIKGAINIFSDENFGCISRHAIANLAKTKYVLFVDDDFFFEKDLSNYFIKAIKMSPNSIIGLFGTNVNKSDKNNLYTPTSKYMRKRGFRYFDIIVGRVHLCKKEHLINSFEFMNKHNIYTKEDDILLNLSTQLKTKVPSLGIPFRKDFYSNLNEDHALWKRPNHMSDRSKLINIFLNKGWKSRVKNKGYKRKFNYKEYLKSRPDLKKNWNSPLKARLHHYIFRKLDNLNLKENVMFLFENLNKKNINLITCVGVDFDCDYLTHFINYYQKFEIDSFNFILQTNTNNLKGIEKAKQIILKSLPKSNIHIWNEEFDPKEKSKKINEIIKEKFNEWNLVVDIDEFVEFHQNSISKTIEKYNTLIFSGKFIDRAAKNGKPKKIKKNENIFSQFPRIVNYSDDINSYTCKPILFKKQFLSDSLHYTNDFQYYEQFNRQKFPKLKIHHFKWTKTTKDKLIRRKKVYKKKGYDWYVQSEKAIEMFYGNKN
ncbi:hypothetical protein KY321_02595, partial [Candidatus Woesearchaeota archaeon]|nr:hypothetical protein [Candidatus Woesearchaeota archaeon]